MYRKPKRDKETDRPANWLPPDRYKQAGRPAGRQAERQTDIQADRQSDSRTDRQTDRKTDFEIFTTTVL